jgi:undecaprenyl pyrophosphate synthase
MRQRPHGLNLALSYGSRNGLIRPTLVVRCIGTLRADDLTGEAIDMTTHSIIPLARTVSWTSGEIRINSFCHSRAARAHFTETLWLDLLS